MVQDLQRIAKKTRKMREFEEKYGRPIEDLLRDKYRDLGTLEAVGKDLGIDTSTVWLWMMRLGLPTKVWTFPGEISNPECAE